MTSCLPECCALHSDKCIQKFPNKILPTYPWKSFLPNVLLWTVLERGISLRNISVELLPNLLRNLECPFRLSIQPFLPKILVPFVSTSRQMRHYSFPPPYIFIYDSALTGPLFTLSLAKQLIKLKNESYL